jgi:hypothetical protein
MMITMKRLTSLRMKRRRRRDTPWVMMMTANSICGKLMSSLIKVMMMWMMMIIQSMARGSHCLEFTISFMSVVSGSFPCFSEDDTKKSSQ